MEDRWMEGSMMSADEKKRIKHNILMNRIGLIAVLFFFVLYFLLGVLQAVMKTGASLVFNLIAMLLFVIAIGWIVVTMVIRFKLIDGDKYIWTTGFIIGQDDKPINKVIHGRVYVDDFKVSYYGFSFSYKVGDQAYVLDFLDSMKIKPKLAVKMN